MHISRILGHPSPRFGNLDFDPSLPFYTVIHIHSERHKFEDPFVIEKRKTHGKVMAVCCWWKAQVSRFESPPGYTKLAPGQAYSSVQKLPFECWKKCCDHSTEMLFVFFLWILSQNHPKSSNSARWGTEDNKLAKTLLCDNGGAPSGRAFSGSGMCGNVLEGALNRDIEDTY